MWTDGKRGGVKELKIFIFSSISEIGKKASVEQARKHDRAAEVARQSSEVANDRELDCSVRVRWQRPKHRPSLLARQGKQTARAANRNALD